MSDYIKREDALNAFNGAFYPVIAMQIRFIPAADVKPVRHGYWIRQSVHGLFVKCSECGGKSVAESDYCSDCGAKMDGDK